MSRMSNLDCDRRAGYFRRLRRVEISSALFVEWFRESATNPGWRVTENGWPADAEIVNVCMSPNQMGVIVWLTSDSFEPVSVGLMVPLGPAVQMEKVDNANSSEDPQPTPAQ